MKKTAILLAIVLLALPASAATVKNKTVPSSQAPAPQVIKDYQWDTVPRLKGRRMFIQSMSSYGNHCITAYGTKSPKAMGDIFDMRTGKIAGAGITYENAPWSRPHCNMASFGKEHLGGNKLPVLYLSQWDRDKERGTLVYDIKMNGDGSASAVQVQRIRADVPDDILGSTSVDWVVDTDAGNLYSFGYSMPGNNTWDYQSQYNTTKVCVFRLPKLSEGEEVVLTGKDLVDNYDIEAMVYRQDAAYHKGKIYIATGIHKRSCVYLKEFDLKKKCITRVFDLRTIVYKEPEGVFFHGNNLIINFGRDELYTIKL